MFKFAKCVQSICLVLLITTPIPGLLASPDNEAVELDEMSIDEIARELSNPITSLRYLGNEIEYRPFQGDLPGAEDQTGMVYRFQPSYPFRLDNGKNIMVRASIPLNLKEPEWRVDTSHPIFEVFRDYTAFLLRQSPQVTADSGDFRTAHGHLSDITFDVAYGGTSSSGFISMYGIAGEFSTSQNISGSRQQTLLGPQVAFGKSADWGVLGAWVKHLVNIAGDESFDTNETSIKLFFAYGLGNGWQIISNPTILYDWEADSGNELLLPLGGGVSKTTRLGRVPVKMELEIQKYIVSPDRFGPEWQLTFNVKPVFKGW